MGRLRPAKRFHSRHGQLVAGGDGQIDALPAKHESYLRRVLMWGEK